MVYNLRSTINDEASIDIIMQTGFTVDKKVQRLQRVYFVANLGWNIFQITYNTRTVSQIAIESPTPSTNKYQDYLPSFTSSGHIP